MHDCVQRGWLWKCWSLLNRELSLMTNFVQSLSRFYIWYLVVTSVEFQFKNSSYYLCEEISLHREWNNFEKTFAPQFHINKFHTEEWIHMAGISLPVSRSTVTKSLSSLIYYNVISDRHETIPNNFYNKIMLFYSICEYIFSWHKAVYVCMGWVCVKDHTQDKISQ
jgi:hypothetical protein